MTKASDYNRKRILKAKHRNYLSCYVYSFVPDFFEMIVHDIADAFIALPYVFRLRRFKDYRVKSWMGKH